MILKKLSNSDIGEHGQRAVNIPTNKIDHFNINGLINTSTLPNEDYNLVLTERYTLVNYPIVLSFKPSSKQWRVIGLSNNNEFFRKKNISIGDYLLIHKSTDNGQIMFEVQKPNDNPEFLDFLMIYYYLIDNKSFRDIDKAVFNIDNQNGSKSHKQLKNKFKISENIKDSFQVNGFEKEYQEANGEYHNALNLLKKYYFNFLSFKPINKIFFGAPGTGKSYKVDNIINGLESKYFERLTFHPEFDNSSFIGGYKPISEKDSNGNEVIKYKFIPQAFTNIYKRAWEDKDNQYHLVIEEINRGNCAEIFGEIFQLLDRNSNYTVSPSKELKDYLVGEDGFNDSAHEGIVNGLRLPPNLSILATMNTSDQSLFPMDSAFKRRWEWEYVPICYTQIDDEGKPNSSFDYTIDIQNGKKYSWIKFIEQINLKHIKTNPSLGMDKCIGNYFIKPDDELIISLKPFINKVIFYLWNDVFKDEANKVFEANTYEDFFPIATKGKSKIEELFNRIELKPIAKEYSIDNESQESQIAADEPDQYGNGEQ